MESDLIFVICAIIFFIIVVLSLLQCNSFSCSSGMIIENYEERMGGKQDGTSDIPDFFDKEFVDLYENIYNDNTDSKNIIDIMDDKCLKNIKDKSLIKIMVGGCGVNKTGSLLKKKYDNVICVDKSANMLLKAQILHPECKYIHGDLGNKKLFGKNEFSHILLDERMLYYNKNEDIIKIIENCNYWLADQGFLIIPIYNPDKFTMGARYYSTHFLDDKNNLHGFTYLNDYAHDCYYIKDIEGDENEYSYYDKIVLDNGKKRIKITKFYIPEPNDIYTIILRRYFKIFYTEKIKEGTQVVGGYETVIFRKERNKMNIEEIEKKYN